jgi:putative membrane protein
MWWNNCWLLGNNWGWAGIIMMVFMGVFWAGTLALGIWLLFRLVRHGTHSSGYGTSALDIARERYARGDISREAFEQIKKDLS